MARSKLSRDTVLLSPMLRGDWRFEPRRPSPEGTRVTIFATSVYTDRSESLPIIETTAHDDWRAKVSLRGELDAARAPDLFLELALHVTAGRTLLRLDLDSVSFIDSTALAVLATIDEQCRRAGGTMIVTGVSRPVRRLLDITDLSRVLLVDTADREPAQRPGDATLSGV